VSEAKGSSSTPAQPAQDCVFGCLGTVAMAYLIDL
jgi:hypothetical protein